LGGEVPCRHGDVHGCSGEGSVVCPHPHRGLPSPRYVKKITVHYGNRPIGFCVCNRLQVLSLSWVADCDSVN
jgi:hypothetical protein